MKIKLKNILMISFLAVAGIFGVTTAVVDKQAEETPVVEKAEATSTFVSGTRVFIKDETSSNWCNSSIKAVAHLYNVYAVDDSGYSGIGDIVANDIYGTIKSTDNYSYIDITMVWDSVAGGYQCILPWYIKSFKVEFYAPDNGKDRHLYFNGGSTKVYRDCNVGKNVRTYITYIHGWDASSNAYASTSNGDLDNYTWEFHGIKSGTSMFLSTADFTGWEGDSAKFGINFCKSNVNKDGAWGCIYSDEERVRATLSESFLRKVEGSGNDHLFECIAPKYNNQDVYWSVVIGVRFNPAQSSPAWNNVWSQTPDQYYNSSDSDCNFLKITGWSSGYLDSSGTISDETRASYYGTYFNSCIVCSGAGSFTGDWSTVSTEYYRYLSTDAQGKVWNTTANPSGTGLPLAMSKYDYIVGKYGSSTYPNFINRSISKKSAIAYFPLFNMSNGTDDTLPVIIIIVASSVALLSITALSALVVKKRKAKEE